MGGFTKDGATMIGKGFLVILTGGTMVVLVTNLFRADAAGVPGLVGLPRILLFFLGLGLVGLSMWGRKKFRQGTSIDGRDKGK